MKWARVDGDWQFGEHATVSKHTYGGYMIHLDFRPKRLWVPKLAGAKMYAEKAVRVELERRAAGGEEPGDPPC